MPARPNSCANSNITLTGPDCFHDNLLISGTTEQIENRRQVLVILTDNRQGSIEDRFADSVEIHSQSVSEQRSTGNRAHWIECDNGQFFAASM